jgi:putative tricarboxylic transport membrane protein
MLMSQGNLDIFFSNALVSTITVLAIILLTWPLWAMLIGRAKMLRTKRAGLAD